MINRRTMSKLALIVAGATISQGCVASQGYYAAKGIADAIYYATDKGETGDDGKCKLREENYNCKRK